MGKGQPSLGDAIRAAVPATPVRSQPWWARLDPDALAEIESVKADWKAGRMPGSRQALAKAIAAELNARGISDIGVNGVTAWLARD